MKRSEMIKKIATAHSELDWSAKEYDYDELASHLLSVVEKSGMLPPPDNTDVIHSSLVYCYYIDKTYSDYERLFEVEDSHGKLDYGRSRLWEPEDEEK